MDRRRGSTDSAGHGGASTRRRLSKAARHERILAEFAVDATLRVADLAARFGVTTETIRRDLDALAEAGLINRTYGGAARGGAGVEPGFNERYRQRVEERRVVAEQAAALVDSGDVLMIDAGSTTTHLARRLAADARELTVLTNSIGVATALASNAGIRVVLCPGDYDAREGGVCGAETVGFVRRFHAAKCFIGASGLTEEGACDANHDAAWVKRAMLERSDRRVLVVDASKFGVGAVDRICELGDLHDVVSDAPPPARLARALGRAGVTVHFPEA